MPPRAQLAVRRDHVALWYRRAAGELWTLDAACSRQPVLPEAWLVASPRAELEVAAARPGAALAALRHPRSGRWVWLAAEGLLGGEGQLGAGLPGALAALAWSWDGHRLYAATAAGALWSTPVASAEPAEQVAELSEPATGDVALAVGPAGLVVTTSSAVWGINVRQRRAMRLLSWPALRAGVGLPERSPEQAPPAVAVDARGWLYLADATHVVRVRADGSGLALIASAGS